MSVELIIHDEPKWILEDVLFAIHAQQVERFGGLHGVRDANVVRSALARPVNKWTYEKCDLADLAAMYLVGFVGTQGFNDGNKRTGLACALVFLSINGVSVETLEPDALYHVTLAIANNEINANQVAEFLRIQLTKTKLCDVDDE